MANEEQLSILKQGVYVWNLWRKENLSAKIDLSKANLFQTDLTVADLSFVDLKEATLALANLKSANLDTANLSGARLSGAKLIDANLRQANLSEANLDHTYLNYANLSNANLSRANLRGAYLTRANLWSANLSQADVTEANLSIANLSGATLNESNFTKTIVNDTFFGHLDLSKTIRLDAVIHEGPSTIGIDTIANSKGRIPDVFLRGCGLSDWEIEAVKLYNPDLSNDKFIDIQNRIFELRMGQTLQISPLFISYSHGDGAFVDKIESKLNERGIRFWRDIHDMKSGKIETQIDRAIRQNPTMLLILSEHSVKSDWVEHEVRTARGLEKEIGRNVLCPITLDDSWKNSPWPERIMEQVTEYNILDSSAWEDDSKFGNTFNKLIDGLGLFYKG